MKNTQPPSEIQHILKFTEKYLFPIKELDYDSHVSFIDFIILDERTKEYKICIEFKKNPKKKDAMFSQLQKTKGILNMSGTYKGFYGAINSTHFYVKDND